MAINTFSKAVPPFVFMLEFYHIATAKASKQIPEIHLPKAAHISKNAFIFQYLPSIFKV
jgi:hypothetical protein